MNKLIKNICEKDIINDFNKLKKYNLENVKDRSRIGNMTVDFFTLEERLNTKGRKGYSFIEFYNNRDYWLSKNCYKKFLDNLIKNGQDDLIKNLYVLFKLSSSSINIFKPLNAMLIYDKFKPNSILDFTAGWGGRLVGACALNVKNYFGIDNNMNLKEPYNKMKLFLNKYSTTEINMFFCDCLQFDYSTIEYDMVFTSPPYYNKEIYGNTEIIYKNKKEWNELFYIPVFEMSFKYLQKGGIFCLNIPDEIYKKVCIPLFGKADVIIPLMISKRQNNYREFIYCWWKPK